MALDDALRHLADEWADGPPRGPILIGTIASITPAGGADGNTLLTVTVGGSTFPAVHADSYTSPAVGHLVLVVLAAGGAPAIVAHLVGTPNL